jgi:hypothetical protein
MNAPAGNAGCLRRRWQMTDDKRQEGGCNPVSLFPTLFTG